MSEPVGVWNASKGGLDFIQPPTRKRNLIGPHTPISECPEDWLREIEPRVVRPAGWNNCWFLGTMTGKGRAFKLETQQHLFRANPMISVHAYDTEKGWHVIKVRARSYIAQMFFEWAPEPPKYVKGYARGDRKIAVEKPRSMWLVKCSCKDERCINPMHFTFDAPSAYGRKK